MGESTAIKAEVASIDGALLQEPILTHPPYTFYTKHYSYKSLGKKSEAWSYIWKCNTINTLKKMIESQYAVLKWLRQITAVIIAKNTHPKNQSKKSQMKTNKQTGIVCTSLQHCFITGMRCVAWTGIRNENLQTTSLCKWHHIWLIYFHNFRIAFYLWPA